MTLAEEREFEIIKRGLAYKEDDAHTSTPHWDAKYPWTEDPASLPNNKRAVQACFLKMEKQLGKEPDWKVAYATQIHEMVQRGAAIKLTNEVMEKWEGPVWYKTLKPSFSDYTGSYCLEQQPEIQRSEYE